MQRSISCRRLLLPATALFALFWVIARACLQSITIDEADTYLSWVAPFTATHWTPAANNQVLNSALMRLFTGLFGTCHLTVRMPALIGAAVYILAAYSLCRMIGREWTLQWPLFLCLVYNPLVMDFLVAARGYGMATAFLVGAVAMAASAHLAGWSRVRACALSSVSLALSAAANLSFAFVDAAALVMILVWACAATEAQRRPRQCGRLLAACVLPGLAVSWFLTLSIVLDWPKGQLVYGAHTLGEMLDSLVSGSLFELNRQIANPLVYGRFHHLQPWVFPLFGIFWGLQVALILRFRAAWRNDARSRRLAAFGIVVAAVVALSLAAHWLAHVFSNLLLPKDRTGLYLVPLAMILAGLAAGFRMPTLPGRVTRTGLVAMLFLLGAYHILSLRLTYFKEWAWDADVRQAYDVLAYYNHTYGARTVATNWRYTSALNYYRLVSGRESFPKFASTEAHPPGREIYVLIRPFEGEYLDKYGLKTVFYGERSEMVVAINPALEAKPAPSARAQ